MARSLTDKYGLASLGKRGTPICEIGAACGHWCGRRFPADCAAEGDEVECGAAGGDRTHDPWLRRPILYPLSYSRTAWNELDYHTAGISCLALQAQ